MKCTIIPNDISQKMAESIFKYQGRPYYVRHSGGNKIDLYELQNATGHIVYTIKYDDDGLDFSSIPLGYVNLKPYVAVVYLTRVPVRKVKQGINTSNTKMNSLPGSLKKGYNMTSTLFSEGFVNMAIEKYPSLEESLEKLRKKDSKSGEVAISRSIALMIDEQDIIKVFYKNEYVGWIQPGKFLVHVKSDGLGWVVSKYLSHILGWQID